MTDDNAGPMPQGKATEYSELVNTVNDARADLRAILEGIDASCRDIREGLNGLDEARKGYILDLIDLLETFMEYNQTVFAVSSEPAVRQRGDRFEKSIRSKLEDMGVSIGSVPVGVELKPDDTVMNERVRSVETRRPRADEPDNTVCELIDRNYYLYKDRVVRAQRVRTVDRGTV